MTNRIESKIPFVGLHAHSGLYPFDVLGMPGGEVDGDYENGMNGHAVTEQGHMNAHHREGGEEKKIRNDGNTCRAMFDWQS